MTMFRSFKNHLSKAWKWDWTNQNFHPSIWMNGCWIVSNLKWTPHPVRPCPTKIWHASTHLQDSSSIVNYHQLIRLFIHSTTNIESTTPFRNPAEPTEAAHWARSVWVFVEDLKSDQGTTSKVGITLKKHQWTKTSKPEKHQWPFSEASKTCI